MDDEPGLGPALQAVIDGRSLDPFAMLGRHRTASGDVVRVMLPGAFSVTAVARDNLWVRQQEQRSLRVAECGRTADRSP